MNAILKAYRDEGDAGQFDKLILCPSSEIDWKKDIPPGFLGYSILIIQENPRDFNMLYTVWGIEIEQFKYTSHEDYDAVGFKITEIHGNAITTLN